MPDFVGNLRFLPGGFGPLIFPRQGPVGKPALQGPGMNDVVSQLLLQFQPNQRRSPGGMFLAHPLGRINHPLVRPALLRPALMIMNVQRFGPLFPITLHKTSNKPRRDSQTVRHHAAGLTGQRLLNHSHSNRMGNGASHHQPP